MIYMNFVNINIGCGSRLVKGYINFDNSFSVKLSKMPLFFIKIMYLLKILALEHYDFIKFLKKNSVKFCDARHRIPMNNQTVDNVYSSHTLEHLRYHDADMFLKECHRVLKNGGGIRLVVPNLRLKIEDYNKSKDADDFFFNLGIFHDTHINFNKFKNFIRNLLSDSVGHKHMYDENSLKKKLIKNKFIDVTIVQPGSTVLKNLEELDLFERSNIESKSLYIEARK
mgnify:FL=1